MSIKKVDCKVICALGVVALFAISGCSEKAPVVKQEASEASLQPSTESKEPRTQWTAEYNIKVGGDFLMKNAHTDGVLLTENALQYRILRSVPDDLAKPGPDDKVKVHYKGSLLDGTEFRNTFETGNPDSLILNQVVDGLSEGIQLMKPGEKFKFILPPSIGYGDEGTDGVIGKHAVLIYEVELLEVLPN